MTDDNKLTISSLTLNSGVPYVGAVAHGISCLADSSLNCEDNLLGARYPEVAAL